MDCFQQEKNTFNRHLAGHLLKLAHKFKANLERAVSTGDVEAVHDLRVASRRMSEPLLIIEENLPDSDARAIRKTLRRFRGEFRIVRDLDVLTEVLSDASETDSSDCELLVQEVRIKRGKELERAARRCAKLPLSRLIRRIRRLGHQMQPEHLNYQAICTLNDLLEERAGEVRGAGADMERGDLHPLRIAIKKMKYCAELVDKLRIRDEKPLIDELAGLQTVLGHWNDKTTGARWLAKFAGRRKNLIGKKEQCLAALRMADAVLEESESDRRTLHHRWPALIDKLDQLTTPGNGFQRHVGHAPVTTESV